MFVSRRERPEQITFSWRRQKHRQTTQRSGSGPRDPTPRATRGDAVPAGENKARGRVNRKETAGPITEPRKRGRQGGLDARHTPGTHGRRQPGPIAPPRGRGCAGKGTAHRKGRGHALQVPCAALTSAVEGGSADYRMRFLVALLLLSVAVAGKNPPGPPKLIALSPLGSPVFTLAGRYRSWRPPCPTRLWPSPLFSHSAITTELFPL